MIGSEYLQATDFLDFNESCVAGFAQSRTLGATTVREKMVRLYYAVRDEFLYNPYRLDLRREGLKASGLVRRNRGYCIEKAILLAACARYHGVPSRLSFYIVRNHIGTAKLERIFQKDYLVFHGAAELFLDGKWLKTTPAFNSTLCDHLGVEPLEFDGTKDSIFQEFDGDGNIFMSYLHEYGSFPDMPYELYLSELRKHYNAAFETAQYELSPLVFDFTRA